MSFSSMGRAIEASIEEHRGKPGSLLPILHGIQDRIGHIPEEAVTHIADSLNLSRAEVHGVISFYHHFRQNQPGRHVIQICQAESCQAMGSQLLTAHAKKLLGIDFHETTADGEFTLEPVYCLGNCACSPAVMIGEDVHGRVNCDCFGQLLEQARKESRT